MGVSRVGYFIRKDGIDEDDEDGVVGVGVGLGVTVACTVGAGVGVCTTGAAGVVFAGMA